MEIYSASGAFSAPESARMAAPAALGDDLPWGQGGLGGIDHRQMNDAPLAQPLPQHPGQRAGVCFGKVGDGKAGGIQLVARTHAADDGRACRPAAADQLHLGGDAVDGVDHIIQRVEGEGRRVFLAEKLLPAEHLRLGLDVADAPGHHLHLWLAHRGGQGDQLAVDIALADGVAVHQQDPAYAGPCQRFCREGANAPHAEHRHKGPGKPIHALLSQQKGRALGAVCPAHRMVPPPRTSSS